jgi:hypothetical protein
MMLNELGYIYSYIYIYIYIYIYSQKVIFRNPFFIFPSGFLWWVI